MLRTNQPSPCGTSPCSVCSSFDSGTTISILWEPDVPPLAREPVLVLAELADPHRRDDRPVVPDRTALQPPPAQPYRLERHTRDPERREQMPLPAAHDDVAADRVAAQPHRHRLRERP